MTARGPRILLAVLLGIIVVVASTLRGHSVESMDVRTYVQMTRAVAEHGLPWWNNGPVDRFTALVVPWGIAKDGHIWGIYGPLYPYLMAPAFLLGGLPAVSAFTFAILAPLALFAWLLTRRVAKSPWTALAAAVLCVISTPITGKAMEMTAFPLSATLATLGMYLTARLLDPREEDERGAFAGSPLVGIGCGVAWAAASAAHALCYPMAFAALALLGLRPAGDRGLVARLTGGRRLPFAFAGWFAATLPVAFLNHLRFGSYNPVSYGPIPWTGLVNPELLKMNLGHQARYSAGPALFVLVALVAIYLLRGRRRVAIGVGIAAILVAFAVPYLRERFVRYGLVACGYVVDMTWVDLGPAYPRAADGLGRFFGGWVPKAMLQCTPILALAPLALVRGTADRRWPTLAILLPSAALFVSFVTRANLVPVDAIGWPWMYIRYTMPALPGLLVAALVVVERLEPTVEDLVGVVLVGAPITVAFHLTEDDTLFAKRFVLLVATVVAAGLAVVVVLLRRPGDSPRKRHLQRLVVAVAIGLGIASGLGHDLRGNVQAKHHLDRFLDRVDEVVPPRFAMIGWLGGMDVVLTTAATHDVEYADIFRVENTLALRPLIDHWHRDGRPIFVNTPFGPLTDWPDIQSVKLGVGDLYRLDFVTPTPAPP